MRITVLLVALTLSIPSLASSLASGVGLFVYPPEGVTKEKREQDDYQCYAWAKDETDFDPMNAKPPEEVQSSGHAQAGSGARGAFRGAARGALLGEIVDDNASDGAAAGAAIGMMRGRSASRRQSQQQAASTNAQNEQAFAEQQNNFKRAMSLCLEARGYAVK